MFAQPEGFLRPSFPVASRFHSFQIKNCFFTVPTRYRDLRYLAGGAQGTVVVAYDTISERDVVIKKLHRAFVLPADAQRTYREFVLLTSIRHANIIPLFSAFTPDASREQLHEVYLVMELQPKSLHSVIHDRIKMEDGTLKHEHSLGHKEFSFFIYQMLCAVNHLHKMGTLHRDIKPSNMVISDRCILKLLDFGLARRLARDTRHTIDMTTRHYRAPEILLQLEYCEKVDVWSIGCIFGEMITRQVLLKGANETEQVMKILNMFGRPSDNFLAKLSPELARMICTFAQPIAQPIERLFPDDRFAPNSELPKAQMTAANARDLLARMLAIDPEERCSVAEALQHPYVKVWFREEEVNAPETPSRYNSDYDEQQKTLEQWKSLIFDEVKAFERIHDVFGG